MENMNANSIPPLTQEPPRQQSNPLAIVALVIAIVAICLGFVPFLGLIIALVALVLGVVAKGKSRQCGSSGLSIIAIVIAVLALMLGLAFSACSLLVFQGAKTMERELKNQGIDMKELVNELNSEATKARLKSMNEIAKQARAIKESAESASADNSGEGVAQEATDGEDKAEIAPSSQDPTDKGAPEAAAQPKDKGAAEMEAMQRMLEMVGADLNKLPPAEREKIRALMQNKIDGKAQQTATTP